jgi:hypothetical protein
MYLEAQAHEREHENYISGINFNKNEARARERDTMRDEGEERKSDTQEPIKLIYDDKNVKKYI